ncbi:MAG: CpaF family protein [Planctomycetota bacterium]
MADRNDLGGMRRSLQDLRQLIHRQVVTTMDIARTAYLTEDQFRAEIRVALLQACAQRGIDLPRDDQDIMVHQIMSDLFGFGPLEQLMHDPEVTDILVNGWRNVYVERDGVLHSTDVHFANDETLLNYIQRLVTRMGRRIDESSPMVDIHLPDGSRLNAVIAPLALRGPTLSIRRFRSDALLLEQMVQFGSLTMEMAEFLARAVEARANIMISGATGSGKTTLLNSLSRFISRAERVVTIEHTAELQLQQPDVVALEARPPNIEGRGEIHVRDLLRNTLRMRPDRIIVGECRGGEVFDVLQAMITGHDGSMSTIHASDTREAMHRMELMIALSGVELPRMAARHYISSAVHLIVHLKRLNTGERKVMRITELNGFQDGDFVLEDIFGFKQAGVDGYGRAKGNFFATGYRPRLLERMDEIGVDCRRDIFEPRELAIMSNGNVD